MGKKIIEQLLPTLEKMKWPSLTVGSEQGKQIYWQSWERVEDYQGNPKELAATLRLLQTADSRPYALAGVAFLLVTAAREKNGSYAEKGLEAAMKYLEAAQEMEPDITEINVIEALIYIHSGRFEDARLILDYLQGQDSTNYYLHLGEVAYWTAVNDLEQTVYWFNEAAESSLVVPQRLRLQARLGDFYLKNKLYDEAIKVFRESLHFDKENALMWHKLSVAYWQLQDYEEAEHANRRALKLEALPAARKMEAALKKKSEEGNEGGVLGRLFGRS